MLRVSPGDAGALFGHGLKFEWAVASPATGSGSLRGTQLRSANKSEYERDNQKHNGYPEKKACALHSRTSNAAEAKKGRDQRDD